MQQFTSLTWFFAVLFVMAAIAAGWLLIKNLTANQDLKNQNTELQKQVNQLKQSAQKAAQPVQNGN